MRKYLIPALAASIALFSLLNNPHRASASNVVLVPEHAPTIQQAISQVPHMGVIDIAPGTYAVPASGLWISDLGKSFTIRSRNGISSSVVLDGQGNRPVLIFMNTMTSTGGTVTFEGITFANGYSTQDGKAGGLTMQRASAVFRQCRFINNHGQQPNSGGGGTVVGDNSVAVFENCLWKNNTAYLYGGGLAIGIDSNVQLLNSTFEDNSTKIPNHAQTAAGGGVHVSNSRLFVFGSVFRNNIAGYVGGGLYAIGSWAPNLRSRVTVRNTIFEGNKAERHSSVSFPYPTESGAVHAEDNAAIDIHRSYFFFNSAMTAGAIGLYRAAITVTHSYMQGNTTTGVGSANGFGGAISAISSDIPTDGGTNYPSARLTVQDTLIHGVFPSQAANGIYAAGDANRQYGLSGVSIDPNLSYNRAQVVLRNVAFYNTDVQETANNPGTGVGGAIVGDLANIQAYDVVVIGADAVGSTNSSGGAIALLNNSLLTGQRVTLAYNTSDKFGGALFVQGSEMHLFDCQIFGNEISPNVSENLYASYGAAIFTAPDDGRGLPVGGQLNNCIISDNVGLPLFDDDRPTSPYNFFQYNGNRIYNTTFGNTIYRNSVYGSPQNVSGLNNLDINRPGVGLTSKSAIDNIGLSNRPALGIVHITPRLVHPSDPLHYFVYAWNGSSATLNNSPLSNLHGLHTSGTIPASYILSVNGGQHVSVANLLIMSRFLPFLVR